MFFRRRFHLHVIPESKDANKYSNVPALSQLAHQGTTNTFQDPSKSSAALLDTDEQYLKGDEVETFDAAKEKFKSQEKKHTEPRKEFKQNTDEAKQVSKEFESPPGENLSVNASVHHQHPNLLGIVIKHDNVAKLTTDESVDKSKGIADRGLDERDNAAPLITASVAATEAEVHSHKLIFKLGEKSKELDHQILSLHQSSIPINDICEDKAYSEIPAHLSSSGVSGGVEEIDDSYDDSLI
ncbi:unnamed protein product, partial [Protopolystoma xenopodis]